ncbi:hypothetical protein Bbelb_373090 [Branchiostoma belcheri]|nr:hypothetical protein Bbelb_373090 [Branchiostoma belcheri]
MYTPAIAPTVPTSTKRADRLSDQATTQGSPDLSSQHLHRPLISHSFTNLPYYHSSNDYGILWIGLGFREWLAFYRRVDRRPVVSCKFWLVEERGVNTSLPSWRLLREVHTSMPIAPKWFWIALSTRRLEAVLLERETFSPWQKLPRQQIVPRGRILLASLREKITPTPNKTAKEATL